MPFSLSGRTAALALALGTAVSAANANTAVYNSNGRFPFSGAVNLLMPQFDPVLGTLLSTQLDITVAGALGLEALQPDPSGPCGCSYTDASVGYSVEAAGLGTSAVLSAQTEPRSGLVIPGNPSFRIAGKSFSEVSHWSLTTDSGQIGVGSFELNLNPTLTTAGTAGFGLVLASSAAVSYRVQLTYDYTPPVPEPGTWLMSALGLAVLAARKKLA